MPHRPTKSLADAAIKVARPRRVAEISTANLTHAMIARRPAGGRGGGEAGWADALAHRRPSADRALIAVMEPSPERGAGGWALRCRAGQKLRGLANSSNGTTHDKLITEVRQILLTCNCSHNAQLTCSFSGAVAVLTRTVPITCANAPHQRFVHRGVPAQCLLLLDPLQELITRRTLQKT